MNVHSNREEDMTYYVEALTLHLQKPIEEIIRIISNIYTSSIEAIQADRLEKQYQEAARSLRAYEYPNEEYQYVLNMLVNGEFNAKPSK